MDEFDMLLLNYDGVYDYMLWLWLIVDVDLIS